MAWMRRGSSSVISGQEREEKVEKRDQFGAELVYFSDCILTGRDPEPSGHEGLADVRIVEALIESMRKGAPVQLPPYSVERRPEASQKIELPAVEPVEILHTSPGGD